MTKDAQVPMTASAQLDQQLAREAMKKALAGQSLTAREREALKRHEKQKEEKLRWAYYRSIPLKHWRSMAGRQTKVLKEQAALYGIPFAGATISLPDVVRAIHDFLARNAQKLACDEDELLEAKVSSPALERYREERAAIARLERLEREGKVLPRDEMRDGLSRIATVLRGAGETLQRQFGVEAIQILDEALDDAQAEVERLFGEGKADANAEDDAA